MAVRGKAKQSSLSQEHGNGSAGTNRSQNKAVKKGCKSGLKATGKAFTANLGSWT